jgi:hypothetical protein
MLSTTDAQFLIKAFAQSIAAVPPDASAERRTGSPHVGIGDPGCEVPAVALINLLRLNDVAADLVLVWMRQTSPSDPARLLDGLAVYVPSLGHYVDPTAADWHKNATFDRFVRAHAGRAHIIGPAPNADPASDPCASTCMVVHDRVGDSLSTLLYSVPVKTETIHVPKGP